MARKQGRESDKRSLSARGSFIFIALISCGASVAINACAAAAGQDPAPLSATLPSAPGSIPTSVSASVPPLHKATTDLYLNACSTCHGEDMSGGHGPALTGPEFSERWTNRASGDLERVIRTSMPADDPGSLSAEQAKQLAQLIQSKLKTTN